MRTAHLAEDARPNLTLCGLDWEAWQTPDMPTDEEIGFVELPYGERVLIREEDRARRREGEPVAQCQACWKAAWLPPGLRGCCG